MKRKLVKLLEADTKTTDKNDIDWENLFADDEPFLNPVSTVKDKSTAAEVPALKVGDKNVTNAATANISPTDSMRNMMSKINMPDDTVDSDVGVPEKSNELVPYKPVMPKDVPAVIHHEITTTDPTAIDPTWHTVANLPGNMSRAILTLGKALFKSFTKTPTEKIVMIGNVAGQGPNSTREVRGVAAWVHHYGKKVDTAHIDFDKTIPGYSAETQSYTIGGVRFFVVKDEFGEYIYAFPEQDAVDATTSLPLPKEKAKTIGNQKRLREDEEDDDYDFTPPYLNDEDDNNEEEDPIFGQMNSQLDKMNVPDDEELSRIDRMRDLELKNVKQTVTCENIPKIIDALMERSGVKSYTHWTMIGHLNGIIKDSIVKFGKALFSDFTHTDISKIHMIGNIGGYGPNSNSEVTQIVKWLSSDAKLVGKPRIDFSNTMPGYSANGTYYSIGGIRFLVIIDPYGEYCYCWPENESVDPVVTSTNTNKMNETGRPHRSLRKR